MRGIGVILCLCVASAPVYAGFADNEAVGISRFEQRQLYLEAIDAIKSGQRGKLRELEDRLTDYPLYPYIEYTEKIYSINRQTPESILDFTRRYQDLPIADQLLENWVYVLAKQGRWSEFLQYYDPERFTGQSNACLYAHALYRVGRMEEANAEARRLWLVPYSQPDECDSVFYVWRNNNGMDADVAWQRFALAMKANETTLGNYLVRYVASEDRALANTFKLVRRSPNYVRQENRFPGVDEKTNEVILYGINRLSYRDPEGALRALEQYAPTRTFPPADLEDTYTRIGIQLALDRDANNLLDTLPANLEKNPALVEARLRLALRQLSWSQVLVFLNLLPAELQESSRWQFWKARVLMGSADPRDQAMAREIYVKLAGSRNFYGFLAADALGVDYQYEDTPVSVSTDEILDLEATPGIQRALELFTLNQRYRARREWYAATGDFDRRELEVAARVAQKWGWYRQAIKSMIDAKAWDDLDIRFPLAYYDSFVSNARTWDIPLQWSFAIARQESAFMPDAKSSAGAMGIMQLLPSTARLTANRHGLEPVRTGDLNEPILNIQLGSAYLGRMLRRFNNNRILASAAYNAGPARVETWLDPTLPLDVWVETLPFPETRDYVENVLMFAAIYSKRLSQSRSQSQPLIYAHEFKDFSNQQITLNNLPAALGSAGVTDLQQTAD